MRRVALKANLATTKNKKESRVLGGVREAVTDIHDAGAIDKADALGRHVRMTP